MRVVVSIGGSVLAPDLDAARVEAYAAAIEELVEAGHELGVVAGGGGVAREYIETARGLGADEIALDDLGIAVTRLNARLLIAALGEAAIPSPAESLEEAEVALRRGEVAVMGGTEPGHTTDAVGTALAESVGADLVVFATSVSGVFDADPGADADAEQFEELSADELIDVVGSIELEAGSNAPVDLLAAKLIGRSGLRGIVLDGTDPDAVRRAIETGEHDGTEIVPES
ncbi:MAG: UMP kinase [Halobacteriales archaeon]